MSASDVNTLMSAASTAIQAGDYATAITKALAAQALLAAIPEAESGGQDGSRAKYSPEAIENFIANARIQQNSSSSVGIQRTKVQWGRTSAAI